MSNEDISIAVDTFRRSHMGELQMLAANSGSALGYGLPRTCSPSTSTSRWTSTSSKTSRRRERFRAITQEGARSFISKKKKIIRRSRGAALFLSPLAERHADLNPLWMATTPPVRFSCVTEANPASIMDAANSSCFGNLRMDSTRYW